MANPVNNVVLGYDIIKGDSNAHKKMTEVMENTIKASKRLETLWTKRTTKTPEEFAEYVADTSDSKGVKCQKLKIWTAYYSKEDWSAFK